MVPPDEQATSIYEQQLGSWHGFAVGEQIRMIARDSADTIESLESQLPGVSKRLGHILDLIGEFKKRAGAHDSAAGVAGCGCGSIKPTRDLASSDQ